MIENHTNYKALGLVNTREMFKKAIEAGYAVPAYNPYPEFWGIAKSPSYRATTMVANSLPPWMQRHRCNIFYNWPSSINGTIFGAKDYRNGRGQFSE